MGANQPLRKRYATKKFDSNFQLSISQIEQVKALLQFSPSSINSQPWHFIIANTSSGKERLASAATGAYSANHQKILDASMSVLFCAKTQISDSYLDDITEQEARDGRFPTLDSKLAVRKTRQFYADLHRITLTDTEGWLVKQVYLNLGFFLSGLAHLEIDAVPIEGVDLIQLDQLFNLTEKGLKAVAVVALGKASSDDFNASLPKSRLDKELIFTNI